MSVCIVSGSVAGEPTQVDLADGRTLHCFDLRTVDGPVNLVIENDDHARPEAGSTVVVIGRIRRRFFRAGGATAARTELLVERIVPARRRAVVRRAIEAALDDLDL